MKATGIVRRVDCLGRLVIPKELRTMFLIDTGDPVEMFVDKDCIVLRKYDAEGDMEQIIDNFEQAIHMKSDLLTDAQRNALVDKVNEMRSVFYDNK